MLVDSSENEAYLVSWDMEEARVNASLKLSRIDTLLSDVNDAILIALEGNSDTQAVLKIAISRLKRARMYTQV